MKNNKNITYLIVFIVLLLVIISSMSYAYFRVNTSSDSTIGGVVGNTECLDISYSESNVIDLDNQYPITDEYALNNLIPVTITVTNNCTNSINYVLTNTSLSENTGYIEDNKMRISVKRQKENSEEKTIVNPVYVTELENLTSGNTYTMLTNDLVNRPVIKDFTNKANYVIDREEIEGNTTNMYKVYLWIDYWEGDTTHTGLNNNSTQNQSYKSALSLVINSEETPKYLVTFDPNGGSFANGVSNTKEVVYHQQYGDLPEPSKEGYTFIGWNGKNMLNLSNLSIINDGVTINNNVINFDSSFVENNFASAVQIQKRLNYNYSDGLITWYDYELGLKKVNFTKDSSFNQLYIKLNGSLKDAGFYIGDFFEDGKKYTISLNFDSLKSKQCKATLSNLQIEEGTTATPYEPYYILPTTEVVQDKNHTLKAIWEPVS